jgi:hypothetical protein
MPNIGFISLFVPNLNDAALHYAALLQTPPIDCPSAALSPHPFAAKGPVVFQLGNVELALYECDGRTTHPGDVGIGLESAVAETAGRLSAQGGTVFWGPESIGESQRKLAIGMMPDRHFFEIAEPATTASLHCRT